ncbi:MAG: preprotein translocase subunit SecE [Candidatus Baltobacteraceae bacterium]
MTKAPGGSPDARKRLAGQNPSDFVRSVWLELKRVTWPTRDEWVSATILTIVLVVVIGLFTFACDQLFAWVFSAVHPIAK